MMRVMVVEDEEMIRKGIVMAVDWAALDCIVVGEAANGEQALAVAEDCQPTLIITDLKMPKMDGLEMVRRLREAGSRAYVIILTAYDSFAYAQTAIRLGAVDFLLKPFHDGDLENAVLALQKRIAAQTAPQPEPLPTQMSQKRILFHTTAVPQPHSPHNTESHTAVRTPRSPAAASSHPEQGAP
mgnify:CR=1 FL=1